MDSHSKLSRFPACTHECSQLLMFLFNELSRTPMSPPCTMLTQTDLRRLTVMEPLPSGPRFQNKLNPLSWQSFQSRFESRKTTVSEMRRGTWALCHWSLMNDELSWNLLWSWDLTVNACIINFTKPQIWAMVNQCSKTNMVPNCKPPAIAAKQRTRGKVLWYCKYYKPSWRLRKLSLHQFSFPRQQNEEKMSWCSTKTPDSLTFSSS